MDEKYIWVTMSYSLPPSPSANRVYIWRKLRELGAHLRQGVAILPQRGTNQQRLQQLATKIRNMGGDATIAEMRFVEEQDTRDMVDNFKQQSEQEYNKLMDDVMQLCESREHGSGKTLLRRLSQARSRDFFGTREELRDKLPDTGLLSGLELNLDGGFAELMQDLRRGYRDLSSMITPSKK